MNDQTDVPVHRHHPGTKAIGWVEAVVGPGARVTAIDRATGATSSAVYFVDAERAGVQFQFVLRLYTNSDWLAAEPDLAEHEMTVLQKAHQAGLLVPEPVAFEPAAEVCGAPAVLMSRLDGVVDLQPADFDSWLWQLAEELVRTHSIPLARSIDFPWHYFSWTKKDDLQPPTWSQHPELWAKAIELVREGPPDDPPVFLHRDYHPVNALWVGERLKAIVDWVNGCHGPAGVDIAHCRGNLAAMYGPPMADRFLTFYQQIAGPHFDYHPYWDIDSFLGCLPDPAYYDPWADFGLPRFKQAEMRAREDTFVQSVMY